MIRALIYLVFLLHSCVISAQWQNISFSDSLYAGHRDLFFHNELEGQIVGYDSFQSKGYIFATNDGGANWGITDFPNRRLDAITYTTDSLGFIVYVENSWTGIMKTIDRGQTWFDVGDSLTQSNPITPNIHFFDELNGIFTTEVFWFKTSDGGENWFLNPFAENFYGGQEIAAEGNNLAIVKSANLRFSTDAGLSVQQSTIFQNASANTVAIFGDRIAMTARAQNGQTAEFPFLNYAVTAIGSFPDNIETYHAYPNLRSIYDIEYVSNDVMYAASQFNFPNLGVFLKSIDGGLTWHTQSTNDLNGVPYNRLDHIICVNDSTCYLAFAGVIYKTTNGGGPLGSLVDEVILSTNNRSKLLDLQLFPNPAQTRATIQSSERITSFRLYNSLGVVVKSGRPLSERFEMDLGGLAAGIYLVEVQTEKGVGVEKLVVEK